jgi:hypothetical protein
VLGLVAESVGDTQHKDKQPGQPELCSKAHFHLLSRYRLVLI